MNKELNSVSDKIKKKRTNIKHLNLANFSTFVKIKATDLFKNLKNLNSLSPTYKKIGKEFNILFSKLSNKEISELKEMCIELAEFPQRYFNYSSDLKYHNAVTLFVLDTIKKYESFFEALNESKEVSEDKNYYLEIFQDIKDEISWAKKEYLKRSEFLKGGN